VLPAQGTHALKPKWRLRLEKDELFQQYAKLARFGADAERAFFLICDARTDMEATRDYMYGKIHRCTVTQAELHYVGSITIDPLLLKAAGILPHTRVDVVNIANGARLSTYVIEGPAGSGVICLNGAAAHHFAKGDLAIIMAYEQVPVSQIPGRISRAVHVDAANRIVAIDDHVTPSLDELGKPENNRFAQSYRPDGGEGVRERETEPVA
jgi:aspartate 1-decarboxylase